MTGTVIENLSDRKFGVLVTLLLIVQVTCFLLGGLVAPQPANAERISGTLCKDNSTVANDTTKWFYISEKDTTCQSISLKTRLEDLLEGNMVVVFQKPVSRRIQKVDYSRWQQNLIGVLHVDLRKTVFMDNRSMITLDTRLAYRDQGDPEEDWKLYYRSIEKRRLECESREFENYCTTVPLFELGYLAHDYYLLNVRVLAEKPLVNAHISHIKDIWLSVINQSEGFIKVWVSLKTVFFPSIIAILTWFCIRIKKLDHEPVVLEKVLISLSLTLSSLNLPLEFLTPYFDMPLVLLLADIRQLIFYAKIFFFWLLLFGEKFLINPKSPISTMKQYWLHLCTVILGCIFIFIFDIAERGMQLSNPFYTIWATGLGPNLTFTYEVLSRLLIGIYFLFVCHKTWKALNSTESKHTYLSTLGYLRRLHYDGIRYRFNVLMIVTLICIAFTNIGILLGLMVEKKLDGNFDIEYTSAFFTGLYGMWNVYVFSLLVFYAPSRKKWGAAGEVSSGLQAQI